MRSKLAKKTGSPPGGTKARKLLSPQTTRLVEVLDLVMSSRCL